MAKLEGVKTVDMVGGEITKISYEGAEYVRVDEEAQKGDIGVVKSDSIFSMNEGEFFRVLSGGKYRDNADCPRDANFPGLREEYDIFRKVSAQSSPTLAEVSDKVNAIEQRVGALEEVGGEQTYALGDKVEVIDGGQSRYGDLRTGAVGEITDINLGYFNDQAYEVTTVDDYDRFPAEALRKLSEGEVAEKEAFKSGDYVVGINATQYNVTNDKMRLGEVVKDEVDGRISVKVLRHKITSCENDVTYPVQSKYFRKATDEEIAEATAPKFEEGDYARTLLRGQFSDISEGEVVSIMYTEAGEEGDEYSVYAETPEGETDFFRPQDLEKLEGEDVERIAQFAKAGRKLNEFKKGDVVRVIGDNVRESRNLDGDIGIIVRDEKDALPYEVIVNGRDKYDTNGAWHTAESLELVATVESRVDVK